MRSWKSRIGFILIAILLIIQFIRPTKNLLADDVHTMSTKYEVPESVNSLLQKSCYDCHSNKTNYPWYSEIQPFGWWLNNHIEEGKGELNFSTFTTRPIAVQNHKFEEIIETIKEGEMPLPSYTWLGLHAEAKLTEQQKEEITRWADSQMTVLKQTYPADSLILRRR
jgi:hypothetical protein